MSALKYPKDLTGIWFRNDEKRTALEVLERAEDHVRPSGEKVSRWVCRCHYKECGNLTTVLRGALVSGTTTSCGCRLREVAKQNIIDSVHAGVHYVCNFSDEKLRELYRSGLSTSDITALARANHDNPAIPEGVVYSWLCKAKVNMRPRGHATSLARRKNTTLVRRWSLMAHEATKRKIADGSYYNPASFDINPSNQRKARMAGVKAIALKAKKRREEKAFQKSEEEKMEYLLNGNAAL